MVLQPVSFQMSEPMTTTAEPVGGGEEGDGLPADALIVVDQAVAGREHHQQDAEHDDPGEEVRQVGGGLHDRAEQLEPGLVQRQGQDDGHGHAQDELADAEEQRVGDQLAEVERVEKGLEVLKPTQGLPSTPSSGRKSLKAIWAFHSGMYLKTDKVEQRGRHHQVQPAVFPHGRPQPARVGGPRACPAGVQPAERWPGRGVYCSAHRSILFM